MSKYVSLMSKDFKIGRLISWGGGGGESVLKHVVRTQWV